MFGLAAAPEIAIAVPSDMPAALVAAVLRCRAGSRACSRPMPQCSGVAVNDSALRSCHASRFELTTLSAMLTTWNGCQPRPVLGGQSWCMRDVVVLVEAGERIRGALRDWRRRESRGSAGCGRARGARSG